jgi:hypothetical protein
MVAIAYCRCKQYHSHTFLQDGEEGEDEDGKTSLTAEAADK